MKIISVKVRTDSGKVHTLPLSEIFTAIAQYIEQKQGSTSTSTSTSPTAYKGLL